MRMRRREGDAAKENCSQDLVFLSMKKKNPFNAAVILLNVLERWGVDVKTLGQKEL